MGSVLQGRVQHVMTLSKSVTWHFVNVYQKLLPTNGAGPSMETRREVWEAIDACLKQIPKRHQVVLLGGFNLTLYYDPPYVGRGILGDQCHVKLLFGSTLTRAAQADWLSRQATSLENTPFAQSRPTYPQLSPHEKAVQGALLLWLHIHNGHTWHGRQRCRLPLHHPNGHAL